MYCAQHLMQLLQMNNCVSHKQPIAFYCQNCSDVVCEQCTRTTHSDKLHSILPLQKAFSTRVESIQNYIETAVKQKRNSLIQQISKINSNIQELQSTNLVIKNDILVEMEGITIRLGNAESEKALKFQSQIKRLEHLVNIIDDVFYAFEEAVKVPQKFLLLYKQFKQRIINVDVFKLVDTLTGDHVDLPQEFKRVEGRLAVAQKVQRQSEFINDVLVKILENYQSHLKSKEMQVRTTQSKIIQEYFGINQKMVKHHHSLSMTCYFCGIYMNTYNLNSGCAINKPFRPEKIRSSTFLEASPQHRGTKRHYWIGNQRRKASQSQLPSQSQIHLTLMLIRRKLYQKNLAIQDLFASEDSKSTGKVSKLVFSYVMFNRLDLSQHETDLLMSRISSSDGLVNYKNVNDLIKDKEYLEEPISANSSMTIPPPKTSPVKKYTY